MKEIQIRNDLGQDSINHLSIKDNIQFQDSRGSWHKEINIYKACKDVDAIIVLTEWEEYSKINWKLIAKKVRNPAWVFDARSIVNSNEVIDAGLKLWEIGYGFNTENS